MERHPSVFDWMNGSDNPPPPKTSSRRTSTFKDWTGRIPPFVGHQQAAAGRPHRREDDWAVRIRRALLLVLDTKLGGASGFNTETSPGPAPPPVESLRRMLPADHLWPIDSCGIFTPAATSRKD